jgi:hypothetical protein
MPERVINEKEDVQATLDAVNRSVGIHRIDRSTTSSTKTDIDRCS